MKPEAQILKGHLDTLLLATLENGPRHGYAVKEALRGASGARFDLPAGTIYPALRRLETAGLLHGSWSVVSGRKRRTYELTAAGQRRLTGDRTAWRDFAAAVTGILGASPVPGDLISAYLADLARRLPAGITGEIADGLAEAREHHQARGLTDQDAAHAALAEFGDARQLAAQFTRHAPGRRTARIMFATGPAAGACWGAALISARAWTWPVPAAARIAVGAALLLAVAALAVAATSQHSYRRTRLATPGTIALILLDMTMITTALTAAPAFTWVLATATAASLSRSSLAALLVPRTVTR